MLPDWTNNPNADELLKSTDRALVKEKKTFLVSKRIKIGLRRGIFLAGAAHPGRTFLGKRRYFSGIAALTPLMPLTYKQNAVNAFIPTKKTPLTPLYRQETPLTLLYQKKLVSSKN